MTIRAGDAGIISPLARMYTKFSGLITYGPGEPFLRRVEHSTRRIAERRERSEHDGHAALGQSLIFQAIGFKLDDLSRRREACEGEREHRRPGKQFHVTILR